MRFAEIRCFVAFRSPSGGLYPHPMSLSPSEAKADMIRLALNRYRGQMSEVARKLGIGRSTLYRKVRELGLEAKM